MHCQPEDLQFNSRLHQQDQRQTYNWGLQKGVMVQQYIQDFQPTSDVEFQTGSLLANGPSLAPPLASIEQKEKAAPILNQVLPPPQQQRSPLSAPPPRGKLQNQLVQALGREADSDILRGSSISLPPVEAPPKVSDFKKQKDYGRSCVDYAQRVSAANFFTHLGRAGLPKGHRAPGK